MSKRHITATLSAVLIAQIAGPIAWAQPASNGLVPGIAPYSPPPASPLRSQTPEASKAGSAAATGATSAASTAPGAASRDYLLGPGDELRITVFGEETLSGQFTVAGNGEISFPLIGNIPADGKTVQQVQFEIDAALRDGYLKDPRVSAEVLSFRPYYILGEIVKPGKYPYSSGITVINAVATAGGFTYRANQNYVFVKKAGEKGEHKVRLTNDVSLSAGDTVRITERYF